MHLTLPLEKPDEHLQIYLILSGNSECSFKIVEKHNKILLLFPGCLSLRRFLMLAPVIACLERDSLEERCSLCSLHKLFIGESSCENRPPVIKKNKPAFLTLGPWDQLLLIFIPNSSSNIISISWFLDVTSKNFP